MALGLLCLGLTLLGSLQTQAQDTTSTLKLRPDLNKVPLQQKFKDDRFQGKWYVIAVAEDPIQEGNQFKMHSVTYELQDDHSYNLTTTRLRGDSCEHLVKKLAPSVDPGQFTLNNTIGRAGMIVTVHVTVNNGTGSYTMNVMITDYNQYAMVFLKETLGDTDYFKANLYGRTKELSPPFKKYFIIMAKILSFAEDSVHFSAPIEECIDD